MEFMPRLTTFDDENLFSEAGSPLEFQINFAHRLSKSIPKPISLSEIAHSSWQMTIEIAHSSWQMTLRGRCNYLNL